MSQFSNPVQVAVYEALVNIGVPVYDTAPALPVKMPNEQFPYVVIGEDLISPWSTDTSVGASVTLTLYVWSRSAGMKELKEIVGNIDRILDRGAASLTHPGYHFVDCLFEFSQFLTQSDGVTRQGICRYRLTLEKETT